MKKFEDIEDVDIILEEQKIAKDTSIAHFRINKKMFEIDPKNVKITNKIGQGGGSGVVYSAKWNNLIVAYKCFVVHDYVDNKFGEFEKEVELLSSISFPYILTFYGATLNSQRLGFVMEFAENGDLENFLKQHHRKNKKRNNFNEKLRMLYEISSSLAFLHSKKVIHRDLKPANILITKKEETKLMDFGLSKILCDDLEKTKTVSVGTSYYIAPEVVLGDYSYPCDVFSFSMMIFVVLTENFAPFGKNEFKIFRRISRDPKFRPNIHQLEEIGEKSDTIKQIMELIQKNWDHEPSKRMNFAEITKKLERIKNKQKESKNEVQCVDLKEFQNMKIMFEELNKKYKILQEKNTILEKKNRKLIEKQRKYLQN